MSNVSYLQYLTFIIVNQIVLRSLQYTKTCAPGGVCTDTQPLPQGGELMELAGECPVSLCQLFL